MRKILERICGDQLMIKLSWLPLDGERFLCWFWGHKPDKWTGDRAYCLRCNQVIVWRLDTAGPSIKARVAYELYSLAEWILNS